MLHLRTKATYVCTYVRMEVRTNNTVCNQERIYIEPDRERKKQSEQKYHLFSKRLFPDNLKKLLMPKIAHDMLYSEGEYMHIIYLLVSMC